MSQHQEEEEQEPEQQQHLSSTIPVSEEYWSLLRKANNKFSKIRELPHYHRNRYDKYSCKVFKLYSKLWKFQQENRKELVEAGVMRWEIGHIASRIAQLYLGHYMRTSEAAYLSESYIFYEAVLMREYFKDGGRIVTIMLLRFLVRFLMVCLLLNRREMVHLLVDQLEMRIDESKNVLQESDVKEWTLLVKQKFTFLKADTYFLNIRPLRYSLVLDPNPDSFPKITASVSKKKLKLTDAILTSCQPDEVRFFELTLDTFRMLQCLEWEPSGIFYKSSGTKAFQNGASGTSCIDYSHIIFDSTLTPNPRKTILDCPSVTHFLAVLATISDELPPDGILLVYLSTSGKGGHNYPPNATTSANYSQMNSRAATADPRIKGDCTDNKTSSLKFGTCENGGCIHPCDLIPFTRRPLFIVNDSDSSGAFEVISGAEKGEPAALLLSPTSSPIISAEYPHQPTKGLFTIFLTAPLQAFCLLVDLSHSDVEFEIYNKAEKLLSSSMNDLGLMLASADSLDPVWVQILTDPFLRRLLLRFVFCRAVLTLYGPTFNKKEFLPSCKPRLPDSVLPTRAALQSLVLQIAAVFGTINSFIFSEGITLPEDELSDSEFYSA